MSLSVKVTETEGRPVLHSRAACHANNLPFFRFSPQLDEEIELDEIDKDKLLNLIKITTKYMKTRERERKMLKTS